MRKRERETVLSPCRHLGASRCRERGSRETSKRKKNRWRAKGWLTVESAANCGEKGKTFFRVEVADFCFHSITPSLSPGAGNGVVSNHPRRKGAWKLAKARREIPLFSPSGIDRGHPPTCLTRAHVYTGVAGCAGARVPTVCYDALDWVRLSTPLSPIPRAARSQRTLGVYNGEDHARIPGAMTYREKGIAWPLSSRFLPLPSFPPNVFPRRFALVEDYSPI